VPVALDLRLVRHGVTDWNEEGRLLGRTPIPLNDRGRIQAEEVGASLAGISFSAVLASPQRRTQQTAEAIARARGLEVTTEPGLDEVWLGRWVGQKATEIRDDPDFERCVSDVTYRCEAIEPADTVQQRVVEVVERLRGGEPETPEARARKTVVLVSHADPLRLLLAHYLSVALSAYRRLRIDPASVSLLRFAPPRIALLALNWKAGASSLEHFFD
jgi:broad specificity phosphatase PhoE